MGLDSESSPDTSLRAWALYLTSYTWFSNLQMGGNNGYLYGIEARVNMRQ